MGRIPKALREKATKTSNGEITSTSSSSSTTKTTTTTTKASKETEITKRYSARNKVKTNYTSSRSRSTSSSTNTSTLGGTSSSTSESESDDCIGEYKENENILDTTTATTTTTTCSSSKSNTSNKSKSKNKLEIKIETGNIIDTNEENDDNVKQQAKKVKTNECEENVILISSNNEHISKEEEASSSSQSSTTTTTICVKNENSKANKSNQDWFSRFMNLINSDGYVDKSQFHLSTPHHLKPITDSTSTTTLLTCNNKQILSNLLKAHKPIFKSFMQPNTYYSDLFMNLQPCDSSYLLISSLLNDKIYQLYNECYKKVHEAYEKAQYLIKHNVNTFEGAELTTKEIWGYLVESIPNFVKLVISFAKEVPGLNEIDQSDFTIVINSKLFDFYIIQNASLFINGESYQIIAKNVQYSRAWMNRIKSKEKNDILFEFAEEFNKLNLTLKEKALLSTLCFTFPEEKVKDKEALTDINEYYTRALLYEFDLNKRNHEFVIRFGQILSKLKLVRMIYEAD